MCPDFIFPEGRSQGHIHGILSFLLVGGCEFVEEPGVVLGEEAQVVDLVLEVGDALYTHAECESRVFLAVDAAGFEHSGVYHAAAENLDPSGVLAE